VKNCVGCFSRRANLNFRFSEKATKVENEVEKLKEDSLDSIPSPSPLVKTQIIGWKVYSR
jgi:Txe/YoeB family toxin of Txe-Axe toxin-antitoxin module